MGGSRETLLTDPTHPRRVGRIPTCRRIKISRRWTGQTRTRRRSNSGRGVISCTLKSHLRILRGRIYVIPRQGGLQIGRATLSSRDHVNIGSSPIRRAASTSNTRSEVYQLVPSHGQPSEFYPQEMKQSNQEHNQVGSSHRWPRPGGQRPPKSHRTFPGAGPYPWNQPSQTLWKLVGHSCGRAC